MLWEPSVCHALLNPLDKHPFFDLLKSGLGPYRVLLVLHLPNTSEYYELHGRHHFDIFRHILTFTTWQVRSGAIPDIEQSRESWFRQVAGCGWGIHVVLPTFSSVWISNLSPRSACMEIGFLYMSPLMLHPFCQILGWGQPASTASQFLLVTLTWN